MSKRIPGVLVAVGAGSVVAGVFLWLGLAAALVVGGLALAVLGLLVDVG